MVIIPLELKVIILLGLEDLPFRHHPQIPSVNIVCAEQAGYTISGKNSLNFNCHFCGMDLCRVLSTLILKEAVLRK